MELFDTSKYLVDAAVDLWDSCCDHPFVKGIEDGSLDKNKFKYYMVQDYVYLIDYAKVFALGAAKAREPETMAVFASYLNQILNGEMDIHRGYMARLGIELKEAERTEPDLDNLSYTSYMLRVAYEEGPAQTAVAILSCALSYEHIARRMVKENPASAEHEFYGEWVRGYANDDYTASNIVLMELVNKLAAGYTQEQRSHLKDIFVRCSEYEVAFWDMAWTMGGKRAD